MVKYCKMNNLKNTFKNKKVLITGHTGFKGSWLTLILNELGAEVFGYSLEPPTQPSLYVKGNIENHIKSYIGDIRDFDNLLKTIKLTKPEIIIHMAAQSLVRKSYNEPIETFSTNIMGTVNLLEAIRFEKNIKAFVNVTTDKCYENKEWHWGYRENEPMGGFDPYSNSKACSELVTSSYRNSFFNINNYNEHGVLISSARAGNVIGGGDWADDRLIPDFFRAIESNSILKIRSPFSIRPWQYVLEPLFGYLLLAQKLIHGETKFAEAWNFGPNDDDAKNTQWIISHLANLWKNDIKIEIDKNPQPHEANYLKLDCSKAKNILEWQPKWNIEVSLKKIVEWYQTYYNGGNINDICVKQINEYINY